jgi:hypothetical protein
MGLWMRSKHMDIKRCSEISSLDKAWQEMIYESEWEQWIECGIFLQFVKSMKSLPCYLSRPVLDNNVELSWEIGCDTIVIWHLLGSD